MSNFQAKSFISDIEDSTEVIDLQNDFDRPRRLQSKLQDASPVPSNSSRSSQSKHNGTRSSRGDHDSSRSSKGDRASKMTPIMMENGSTSQSDFLLSGIFGVEDKTYDVNLYNSCVVLTIVGGGKLKSNEGKRMSVKRVDGDKIEISIKDLFGVTIKRQKPKSSKKPGLCQGLELHTYSEKDANRMKHKAIWLAHPSEEVCTRWYTAIKGRLNTITGRPRTARFYMALSGGSEAEFHSKVSPILDGAGLEHYVMKGHDYEKIIKDIEKADLTPFDCILVAGGDTLVHTVVNAIVKKAQFDNGIVLGGKEILEQCVQPIGVIPCGVSNVIAHTVHGSSDMVTAALDIVYGRTLMSDILSVSHSTGSYFQFAFSAQYGFGSNIMESMNKAKLVANKYQIAIAKGLTKNNLRAYNCDVRYKSAPASFGNPSDGKECRSGCSVCNNDSSTPCPDGTNFSDPLQEFDPLDSSNTSSQLTELALSDTRDADIIKGEFLSVSLYATCSPCDMAPRGLCKYTHIADGTIDLVTVKNIERKEFMRFIKRIGNSKNQLDFPFVESHRVKEAAFHIRMPVSWSYRDKDYSEINDQAKQSKSRMQPSATEDTIKVIADGEATVISDLRMDDSSDDDDMSVNNNNSSRASSGKNTTSGATSLSGDQTEAPADVTPAAGQVHIIHKYTETDRRRKKANKKQLEKEMKQKAREEKTLRSTWYLDATPCPEIDLTFRVHQKLVTFYGSGMSPDTEEDDVFCLPAV